MDNNKSSDSISDSISDRSSNSSSDSNSNYSKLNLTDVNSTYSNNCRVDVQLHKASAMEAAPVAPMLLPDKLKSH